MSFPSIGRTPSFSPLETLESFDTSLAPINIAGIRDRDEDRFFTEKGPDTSLVKLHYSPDGFDIDPADDIRKIYAQFEPPLERAVALITFPEIDVTETPIVQAKKNNKNSDLTLDSTLAILNMRTEQTSIRRIVVMLNPNMPNPKSLALTRKIQRVETLMRHVEEIKEISKRFFVAGVHSEFKKNHPELRSFEDGDFQVVVDHLRSTGNDSLVDRIPLSKEEKNELLAQADSIDPSQDLELLEATIDEPELTFSTFMKFLFLSECDYKSKIIMKICNVAKSNFHGKRSRAYTLFAIYRIKDALSKKFQELKSHHHCAKWLRKEHNIQASQYDCNLVLNPQTATNKKNNTST